MMSQFDRGATITGLRGIGGIGKTAIALLLAEKFKSRFKDGQIFLKLDGTSPNPLEPTDAVAQVIRAFRGSAERLPEDRDELQSLYSSVLDGKNVLLLLDNAADRKQVEPLLPPKGCAVIITSRKKFTLPGMPEPFLLETLKPPEARDLLLTICLRVAGHADELAKLCSYLPLALRASASLLAVKSDLNPENYIKELLSERTRLEKIGKEGVDLDVEASFNLSYSRLPAEMARIFCKLSIFPSDFGAPAEEDICRDQGHTQLSNLVTWSLVEFEEKTNRYSLHDLARIFATSCLGTEAKAETQQRHAEHYRDVLSYADQLYLKGDENILAALELLDLELTNIQAGQAWAAENLEAKTSAAELCSSYPYAGASVLDLRLHPRQRISWLEKGVDAAEHLKDKAAECAHLGNLGIAYKNLGEYKKAIVFYEQSLIIAREIGDRLGEGYALGNLGNGYADLGDAKKAIEFYEQALIIAHEIGDRRGEGNVLGCLGAAYADLDDAKKAIEFYEQALIIDREIGDRLGEGYALGNLGVAYADLGDAKKAIEFYEQALIIDREIGNKLGEGNKLGNLGNAYADLGDAKKAIEFYEQALIIDREIGDRRGEGNSLWNMSLSLDKLGQQAEAIESAKSALKIFEQIESPYAEGVRQTLAEWQK